MLSSEFRGHCPPREGGVMLAIDRIESDWRRGGCVCVCVCASSYGWMDSLPLLYSTVRLDVDNITDPVPDLLADRIR